jgi:hypothetical protein
MLQAMLPGVICIAFATHAWFNAAAVATFANHSARR